MCSSAWKRNDIFLFVASQKLTHCDLRNRYRGGGAVSITPSGTTDRLCSWLERDFLITCCAMPARVPSRSASLDQVFDELKTILGRHARLFTEREGMVKNKRDYHLIVQKPLVIAGRKKQELWFASIIQQKDSVGFYFMPMDVKSQLSPELLQHLDGKCCFHFKTLTPALKKHVEAALKIGLGAYRKKKWL